MQKLSTVVRTIIFLIFVCFGLNLWAWDHVILISWDGGGSHYLKDNPDLKSLKKLIANSHYTFESQSESPTITLPNHTSMLTGLPPSIHQVLWNKWEPDRGLVQRLTIFDIVKHATVEKLKSTEKAKPVTATAKSAPPATGFYVGKDKLKHLYKKEVIDDYKLSKSAAETTARVTERIRSKTLPRFSFVHFAEPDVAGHEFAWGSDEYNKALVECDNRLGEILQALEQSQLDQNTAVILTADHGGEGKSHREEVAKVRNIPLIISTPKMKNKSAKIKDSVSNASIARIAAQLLDVKPPTDAGWKVSPKFD
jgi:predicted AlkP superfamily pyrophosphatase or phosphodiesterase